ncbi:MAG: PAS domain S-box protein [Syntrophales bacterium]
MKKTKQDTRAKNQLLRELETLRVKIAELEGERVLPKQKREEEQILGAVLESSPVAMFVIDKNHRVIYWNKAIENLSGIKAREIIGTDEHWRMFYEEKRPCMADLIVDGTVDQIGRINKLSNWYLGKYTKSGLIEEAYEATDFFPRLGENGRWLHFTSAAVRDRQGAIFGAIETFEDITDRIRAEELYRTVTDHSPVGVYVSQNGKFVYVNEQIKKYMGYSQEDLIGMETIRLVHPEDQKRVSEDAVKMLNMERSSPYEFRAITKDGRVKWIMETVASINYQGRRAVLGNYMDITEQKEAEAKIRSLRAVEISILDAIPIAVMGMTNRVINFANNAVENVFGWKPEEVVGRNSRILYRSDEEYEEIGQHFYPVLQREKTFIEEFPCRHRDGRDLICMVSASRIGDYLVDRSIVATYEDITERKRAEIDLKRSFERLQRSMEDTIQTIAMIVETRDPYTAGHQRQVDRLACAIAEEMGLSKDRIDGIHTAAVIHDIGKIYIPAEMLSKPGHLTEIEYDIMKTHPQVSYDILKRIDFPWPVANIVYQHHERFDGSGYPRGLKGDQILLEARILAVADVVESMASHRPYRPTVGIDKAVEEITKNKGILYDPDVVNACLKVLSKGFKFE